MRRWTCARWNGRQHPAGCEEAGVEFFILWFALSIAVGMFASNYRQRSGLGWFVLSLVISPLLGFVFAAVSKPLAEGGR